MKNILHQECKVTVSIVSHNQFELCKLLVEQLVNISEVERVIFISNIPEDLNFNSNPKLKIIKNIYPKGFAENHNYAFSMCDSEFFCVLNPDVYIKDNFFSNMITKYKNINTRNDTALLVPMVFSKYGSPEDSIRPFPTFQSMLLKLLGFKQNIPAEFEMKNFWVAGMIHFFDSKAYKQLGGYDEKFFLYYEDVDICKRIWSHELRIVYDRSITIIHDARRDSRRSFKHMILHIKSALRYLLKSY